MHPEISSRSLLAISRLVENEWLGAKTKKQAIKVRAGMQAGSPGKAGPWEGGGGGSLDAIDRLDEDCETTTAQDGECPQKKDNLHERWFKHLH